MEGNIKATKIIKEQGEKITHSLTLSLVIQRGNWGYQQGKRKERLNV